MVLFDVDGTILDMRYMVYHTLKAYDAAHNTRFFDRLRPDDITVHEDHVTRLMADLNVAPVDQQAIIDWYQAHRWTREAVLRSHQPYEGVFDIIRWIQSQPGVTVGLNTGRPESIRAETLASLNQLGAPHRVSFRDELLHMNPHGWQQRVPDAKVGGVIDFQAQGYRVVAVIDNEPENLRAIGALSAAREILLLHARTIYETRGSLLPGEAVSGAQYDLTTIASPRTLPTDVQLVWHGLNDDANLRQFLASDIEWGECDIHHDPRSGELVLHHDDFAPSSDEVDGWLRLDDLLARLAAAGKSVKLDLKAGPELIEPSLALVQRHGFSDDRLWLNAYVPLMGEIGFRRLAEAHPGAIVQAPISFLEPLAVSAPEKTREIVEMFCAWGMNRFSLDWRGRQRAAFFDQMERWGVDVNLYGVSDLRSFLQAVLLRPRSVTADFNFPEWHLYGRGSGEGGVYYEYQLRD
ncbi:MAG: HAD family hydrolase [Chloroflexi bacterium]|nr:HAD family hydrolase [Chloroflexota bacterium]